MPECYFIHIAQAAVLNWFIVLVLVVYYEGMSLKCNGNGTL